MLLLTGFGALRTKLSLLTVSFGLVGTNPELPFSWKNSISILGSENQGSLSQRGKKRHGREARDLHTFPPPPLCLIFRLLKPMWKSWAQSTLHLPLFPGLKVPSSSIVSHSSVYLVRLKDPWWLYDKRELRHPLTKTWLWPSWTGRTRFGVTMRKEKNRKSTQGNGTKGSP